MKISLTAAFLFAAAVSVSTQSLQAQDSGAAPAPIEAFYCQMRDGKDMKDLMKVADRFGKWADTNQPGYSAWILTPQFGQLEELPDLVWLGSDLSGDALGKGMDAYAASGADIQKDFESIVDCGAHALATSVEVAAPDGPPGDGVVMFTQCSLVEEGGWDQAIKAHKEYSAAMRELGAKNSNWLFFPMLGGPADRGFDYWGVSTFSNWSDYFAAYELYVNGGGWKKGMETLQDAASCEQGTPSVWNVKQVRQGVR